MPQASTVAAWGVVLTACGALVLAFLQDQVPDRSALTEIVGQVRSLEKSTSKGGGLGAVRFSLTTDPRHFSYHSAAGDIDRVWDSLREAGALPVGVLVDPADSHSPPFGDRTYFRALEVRVGADAIRSYPQVVASLRANDSIAVGLGCGTAVLGVALLATALAIRRSRHRGSER